MSAILPTETISVAEMHRRAGALTTNEARRIYLCAVAFFPNTPGVVRRVALSHALEIEVREVEAAERELIRAGLAREVIPS